MVIGKRMVGVRWKGLAPGLASRCEMAGAGIWRGKSVCAGKGLAGDGWSARVGPVRDMTRYVGGRQKETRLDMNSRFVSGTWVTW